MVTAAHGRLIVTVLGGLAEFGILGKVWRTGRAIVESSRPIRVQGAMIYAEDCILRVPV
jgi:hypothetical protein